MKSTNMRGEGDLQVILRTLRPVVSSEEFVFLSFANASYGDHAELTPVASVAEPEGLALVVPRTRADETGAAYDGVFRRLSLGFIPACSHTG